MLSCGCEKSGGVEQAEVRSLGSKSAGSLPSTKARSWARVGIRLVEDVEQNRESLSIVGSKRNPGFRLRGVTRVASEATCSGLGFCNPHQ